MRSVCSAVAKIYVATVAIILVLVLLSRAAEILSDLRENLSALRSVLCGGSASPSVLERSCGAASTTKLEVESGNAEAQEAERPEFAKKYEGDLNICSDATLAGLWDGDMDGEEAEKGEAVVEDGAEAARDDFMSLDITEQELQILECQAAEEFLNEAVPEVIRKAHVNHWHSAEEVIMSKTLKSCFSERR